MYDRWDLSVLYSGLDDPEYEKDIQRLTSAQESLKRALARKDELTPAKLAEEILSAREETERLAEKLFNFVQLSLSVETDNGDLMAQSARLMRLMSEGAADDAAAEKLLGGIEELDAVLSESSLCREYEFVLKEAKRRCAHLLGDETEALISAMDTTGGSAWGDLQSFLTSTLKVDYKGEVKTLSEMRNLAYSPDKEERRAAYEAEIASYAKIEDSVAFAINNIKNQVTTLALKRGYASALELTLADSRMTRKTLDAMMDAINEYLPEFRRYFRKKAEMLGYKGGLPWFEMFAPLGESSKVYSAEDAKNCLADCFKTLSPDMAAMMKKAFDENWIDFYPRAGKEGGAFCAALPDQKQARVLTNFDGTFGAVDTLAHELGHAFHDMCIQEERPLNRSYTMPIAETASTFNELHLGEFALKNADKAERAALLDSTLRETAQCVVDITCRYMFETKVFEQCRDKFLMAQDLNELMLACQKAVYGDGLDENCLNKGMWVCKSHYYSSHTSFYNFPYAFGNLFAGGLYSLYKQNGAAFMADYADMLRLTGVRTLEENAAALGIDISEKAFWEESLKYIKTQIDEFCAL